LHLHAPPPPPREKWRQIPDDLEKLLLGLLEKEPDRRPSLATAHAVFASCSNATYGTLSWEPRAWRRAPWLAAFAVVALLGVAAGGLIFRGHRHSPLRVPAPASPAAATNAPTTAPEPPAPTPAPTPTPTPTPTPATQAKASEVKRSSRTAPQPHTRGHAPKHAPAGNKKNMPIGDYTLNPFRGSETRSP
jgi:hypothetical protein